MIINNPEKRSTLKLNVFNVPIDAFRLTPRAAIIMLVDILPNFSLINKDTIDKIKNKVSRITRIFLFFMQNSNLRKINEDRNVVKKICVLS